MIKHHMCLPRMNANILLSIIKDFYRVEQDRIIVAYSYYLRAFEELVRLKRAKMMRDNMNFCIKL